MKPLIFHAEAQEETEQALAYYEAQRPGLGRLLRLDLESALARIQQDPGAPPPLDELGTRKLRCFRFPYSVYFVELPDAIWIAAVAHQKRLPRYWSHRSP